MLQGCNAHLRQFVLCKFEQIREVKLLIACLVARMVYDRQCRTERR